VIPLSGSYDCSTFVGNATALLQVSAPGVGWEAVCSNGTAQMGNADIHLTSVNPPHGSIPASPVTTLASASTTPGTVTVTATF
jgi:hypothetical protein